MSVGAVALSEFLNIKGNLIKAERPYRAKMIPVADDWQGWLADVFSGYIRPPYATYHAQYWQWLWSIEPNNAASPFVAVWPRGFGKSTSVEVGVAMAAARRTRKYALYVCATQEQADTHVQNIATLLESPGFAKHFPATARRRIGKYGNSQGWRRNRLRTESGFTIDAIGLDTAARGAKVDEDRPDFIIFDDIDEVLDSPATVAKKITTITKSLLPARADHAAVLVAQNLIHEDGIVARLVDGRADFIADRTVSGPHPAITNMTTEVFDGKTIITGGESTWPAKSLDDLQQTLNDMGITAFLSELQHEVANLIGGIFGSVAFRHCRWDELPPLNRIVVWVDPAVTDTENSDAHGIQADGIASNGDIYRLYSWEQRTSPEDVMRRAILKAVELKAEAVGVETDQGGDTWRSTYNGSWDALVKSGEVEKTVRKPDFRQAKAGAGHGPKAHRASLMLADYEKARFIHVIGTHELLERALRRYLLRKPFDLVDAAYWSWNDLRKGKKAVAASGMTQVSRWG